jgi:CRISPR-associated protein Cmr4
MLNHNIPEIPAGFPDSRLLVLWCETPLHPGIGMVVRGGIDLPIQREKLTDLPIMQAPGIKGALKKAAKSLAPKISSNEIKFLFGPEPERASEHAGSMLLTDAHILLFPVSSVRGLVCWITSPMVIARFGQALRYVGEALRAPEELEEGKVAVIEDSYLKVKVGDRDKVILMDELELEVDLKRSQEIASMANWIVTKAIPDDPSYSYIKHILPSRLAMVNDDVFKKITRKGTEVLTRVRLTEDKVVERGGLWSEEHLPALTVLYCSVFMPEKFRGGEISKKPGDVFDHIIEGVKRVVLGGHETVGRGIVRLISVVPPKPMKQGVFE